MSYIWGFKESKKGKKRRILSENKRKGITHQESVKWNHVIQGHEIEPTGKGSDFRIRERDWTGRVRRSYLVDAKSGNAKKSKLQKKTKK